MSCFSCFATNKKIINGVHPTTSPEETNDTGNRNIKARNFTYRELASCTRNFHPNCLLGEGGFGRVYQGYLESSSQKIAVKQLDRTGFQGNKEFLVEVLMLSLLGHPNLVDLIGYCSDGQQRLLVYEFMSNGSLDNHLFGKSIFLLYHSLIFRSEYPNSNLAIQILNYK